MGGADKRRVLSASLFPLWNLGSVKHVSRLPRPAPCHPARAPREVRVMRHTRVARDPATEFAATDRDARASVYEPSTSNR